MISALIFDFDGLLVDTETPALTSWQQIYAEYGYTLGLDIWADALGTNHGFDALEHLISLVAATEPTRAAAMCNEASAIRNRRKAIKERLCNDLPLLPGVLSMLDQAAAMELRCAVASSSERTWVAGWLQHFAISDRFACVLTGDDVTRTKPDPELFLKAAACLELPPAACLVFEDSPNGIKAANAAGCPVVAVPGAITSQLELPPATLRLPSLDALPLDALLAAVVRGVMP